jgi:hypothetical protein
MSESTILENRQVKTDEELANEFTVEFKNKEDNPSYRSRVASVAVNMLPDHVEMETTPGVKKLISYASFKEIVNRALNNTVSDPVIAGMLPPSNVIFISQSESTLNINSYYPGGNRDMLYTGASSGKMHIVAPNIIIGWTMRKEASDWIVSSANYFCTDLPVGKLPRTFINKVLHTKGIYDLPMSNTYGGGAMCYGSNSMPARFKDNNLRGLDWYFRFLWETPFNDDLGVRAIGSNMRPSAWYTALAKQAKDNKVFPYVDLSGYKKIEGSPDSESVLRKS